MKLITKKETVKHTRIQLTGKNIISMLKALNKVKITKYTKVLFTVPGGDYSGMIIEIDKENPITVTSKSYDLDRIYNGHNRTT